MGNFTHTTRAALLAALLTGCSTRPMVALDGALTETGNAPQYVEDDSAAGDAWRTEDVPLAVDAPAVDASLLGEASVSGDSSICVQALQQPQISSDGVVYAEWQFNWLDPSLAQICTTYGGDARMVVELLLMNDRIYASDDPSPCTDEEIQHGGSSKCGIPGSYRFEYGCSAGIPYPRITTPYDTLSVGYYHIESRLYPNPPRHVLTPNPDCPRQLSPSAGLPLPLATGDGPCPMYPSTWRVNSNGTTLWWSHFNWQQDDLNSICVSYGPKAKMVIELIGAFDVPASGLPDCTNIEVMTGGSRTCAIPRAWRIEADCTAGGLLFESSATAFRQSLYHIESAQGSGARQYIVADPSCVRDGRPAGSLLSADNLATGPGSFNGQPCSVDTDCPHPETQICFIDAALTACPDQPIGYCVYSPASNCVLYQGCACAMFYGTTCTTAPAYKCGHLVGCSACSLAADAGLL